MSLDIVCRARLDSDCLHGVAGDPDAPMPEDGTWDGKSIICDPCYIRLMPFTKSGQALHHELDEAILVYASNLAHVRQHPHPATLVAEAEAARDRATPGSPWHNSSSACVAMAKAEVEHREKETV